MFNRLERLLDLLDRKYQLVINAPESDFWLELDQFLDFVLDHESVRWHAKRMVREYQTWEQSFVPRLTYEFEEALEIRRLFAAAFPDLDDTEAPVATRITGRTALPLGLRAFDRIAEEVARDGPSLWPCDARTHSLDSTEVATLINILAHKYGEKPEGEEDEDISLRWHLLNDRHNHLRATFLMRCRVWPPASLNQLLQLKKRINPEPRDYDSLEQWAEDKFNQTIEGIITPQVEPEKMLSHLRRVYEQLWADIGSQLGRYELIERYKQRCMVYDRDRIRELAENADTQTLEETLTRDLALYLFDHGSSPEYRLRRGVHEYDLITPSVVIEVKQYRSSRNTRDMLRRGYRQLISYVNGLEAEWVSDLRELYYVVFRVGGPLYVLPTELIYDRWRIYSVTVDLAAPEETGRRQRAVIEIPSDEIIESIQSEA